MSQKNIKNQFNGETKVNFIDLFSKGQKKPTKACTFYVINDEFVFYLKESETGSQI